MRERGEGRVDEGGWMREGGCGMVDVGGRMREGDRPDACHHTSQVNLNSEEGTAQLSWQPVDLPSECIQYEVHMYRHHGTAKETDTHVYK